MNYKTWLPVIGLTLSAFVFNTSEFMPIGLLTDIANDFNITEAHAGMLISVYAWMVALLSLPLMLLVCRMEMRRLLLSIVGLFIVSHVCSALSATYWQLMLSRIGVACAHSVFWSIATPMAVRSVPDDKRSVAIGIVSTGTSVAMVVGLPLGRVIGMYVGWRTTFACIAAVALLIFLFISMVFPKMPSHNSFSVKKMPLILKNSVLMSAYVTTVLFATAHYTCYSYIEPFLGQTGGFDADTVTAILIAFGAAGAVGSVIFSKYYDRGRHTFCALTIGGVMVALLLLRASAVSIAAVVAVCVLWSAMATAFNVAFQDTIMRYSPEGAAPIGMSIFSGIFNLGIGCGAFIGGLVCTHLTIADTGYVGGAICLASLLTFTLVVVKAMRGVSKP